MNGSLLEVLKRLKALSDTGLLYSNNDYDKERYQELREISLGLLQQISGHSLDELAESFPLVKEYPTAKVDIRALVLSPEGRILMARESADGRWSLPGGWADVGHTPGETVIKEVFEETGLEVVPQRLLAVFDKRKHPHPPQPFYVYKLLFYCTAVTSGIRKGFDVLDVDWFEIDQLPELSEDRILKSQIELGYKKVKSADLETYFD
ncbi:NUDIX hydrolase [Paraflavisolibacter sp. H34]|uniref:NUDIX hydrolase n=1 Tax=Huijunlia imazamoxiresistens TaxID=3127457 RepID=UPI003019EE27